MNLSTTKIELAKFVLEVGRCNLDRTDQALIVNNSKDFWNELSEGQRSEIKLGIAQLAQGKGVTADEYFNETR